MTLLNDSTISDDENPFESRGISNDFNVPDDLASTPQPPQSFEMNKQKKDMNFFVKMLIKQGFL